jgi:cobalt/nickel transport protein
MQRFKSQNSWLVIAVSFLAITPLLLIKGEYQGADSQAQDLITTEHPHYQPWFSPWFKPASPEVESFLFATQAAIGASIVGYSIGFYRGKSQRKK